jgi:integrase/recombinase XerD
MAGELTVSALEQEAADYLAVRRALGFQLANVDGWLSDFARHVEQHGGVATIALALDWASSTSSSERVAARRLSSVRLFARYLQAIDPRTEVPPPGLLSWPSRRRIPYLYSAEDVETLMRHAGGLEPAVWGRSVETALGLLAVTGMRVGEVIALDRSDVDFEEGTVRVRLAKFNKSRLVPVSSTTLLAVAAYLESRRELRVGSSSPALFVDEGGRRIAYPRFLTAFRRVATTAGLPRSARIHDFRHSVAVATILDWYRSGADVHALLPRLSVYLGHVAPKSTYWYLTGSPELMAVVAERLEQEGRP